MGYAPRRALGDYSWADYINNVQAPPNAVVTAPNGDVLYFDRDGNPDHTVPHVGSGTDSDISNKVPGTPFYNWTELDKAKYWAAQGVLVANGLSGKATIQPGDTVPTISAADAEANRAQLAAQAKSDPKIAAALAALTAPQPVTFADFAHGQAARDAGISVPQALLSQYDDLAQQALTQWQSYAIVDKSGFTDADRSKWITDFCTQGEKHFVLTAAEALQQGLITADFAKQLAQVLKDAAAPIVSSSSSSSGGGSSSSGGGSSSSSSGGGASTSGGGSSSSTGESSGPTNTVEFYPAPTPENNAASSGKVPAWAWVGGLALVGIGIFGLPKLRKS